MTTQNIRFFLLASLVLLGTLLYNTWEQEKTVHPKTSVVLDPAGGSKHPSEQDIPDLHSEPEKSSTIESANQRQDIVTIKTDVFSLKVDTVGGDIVQLKLLKYAENQETFGEGFVLFEQSASRHYVAQSGLTGEFGPDKRGVGRAKFRTTQAHYELDPEQEVLTVDLTTVTAEQVAVTKRFIFNRGSYVIDVQYLIHNKGIRDYKGSFYARLKRKPSPEAGSGFLGVQTFTGAAIHTEKTPYKKINFKDLTEKSVEQSVKGGWAAMVEHYFVSAWIPSADTTSVYQANKLHDDFYSVGLVSPAITVLPGEAKTIDIKLYAGPEITESLAALAPGLELATDYGIFWPICQPIFWLLKQMHHFTSNWGVAIILTTVLIKLLFYKLSATSYRSMGNMRKLQPKLEALKTRFGDDKQKFSQAVMELYKKERINPLGGCLPVVVQIPVFIALYYVLLGSVELREAPFLLWITDLSAKDPFYVLPILMGGSMLIQQKLNPAPPDPVQAKVMMFMPVIFTVLFLNFPSGLVLYWFVNNVLSITQQWLITRNLESRLHHPREK